MPQASESFQMLRLLARFRPQIWDAIDPHGPLFASPLRSVILRRGDEVALNPQPLPPIDQLRLAVMLNPQPLPPIERLQVAVHQTAHAVANAAIAARWAGRDSRELLQSVADDWCPTPPSPVIPWPKDWPFPWPPGEPYPIAPEFVTPAMQAEAAMIFQSYASGIGNEELSAAFSGLADRLVDAALQGANPG
jgi:hypothetical protein